MKHTGTLVILLVTSSRAAEIELGEDNLLASVDFRFLLAARSRLWERETACGFLAEDLPLALNMEVVLFVIEEALARMELVEESKTENVDLEDGSVH